MMITFINRETAAPGRRNGSYRAVPWSAAVTVTLLTSGWAQDAPVQPRGTEAQQARCMPDVFRLCPTYIPDEDAILACLQRKAVRLSGPCREVIDPGKRAEIKG